MLEFILEIAEGESIIQETFRYHPSFDIFYNSYGFQVVREEMQNLLANKVTDSCKSSLDPKVFAVIAAMPQEI